MEKIYRNVGLIVAIFVAIVSGVFAIDNSTGVLGDYVYSVSYKALVDYDGVYFSDLNKFSELSTEGGTATTFYRIEETGLGITFSDNYTFNSPYGQNVTIYGGSTYDTLDECGNITAIISYQLKNGTNYNENYSTYFECGITPSAPLEFFTTLTRGDIALVTIQKSSEATNISRLQVTKNIGTGVILVNKYPSLESLSGVFVAVATAEKDLILSAMPFVDIALKLLMYIGVPIGIIIFIIWSFRKIKDGLIRLLE